MEEVASYLNDKKAVAENISRVNDVWNKVSGLPLDLSPDRRFVNEVEVCIGEKGDKRKLYLFNDILMISKSKKGLLKSKEKIDVIFPLKHTSLNWSDGKKLMLSYSESEALYTLLFENQQMKNEWATLIEETANKYKEKLSTMNYQESNPPQIKPRAFSTLRKLSSFMHFQPKEDKEDKDEKIEDENDEDYRLKPQSQRTMIIHGTAPRLRRSRSLPSINDIFDINIQSVEVEDVEMHAEKVLEKNSPNEKNVNN